MKLLLVLINYPASKESFRGLLRMALGQDHHSYTLPEQA